MFPKFLLRLVLRRHVHSVRQIACKVAPSIVSIGPLRSLQTKLGPENYTNRPHSSARGLDVCYRIDTYEPATYDIPYRGRLDVLLSAYRTSFLSGLHTVLLQESCSC